MAGYQIGVTEDAEADDFEKEVAALRDSRAFQRFLAERSAGQRRIPLEEIEEEIEQEPAENHEDSPLVI
jgi:hypothetical protein